MRLKGVARRDFDIVCGVVGAETSADIQSKAGTRSI
jgi:hypothetical protein